MLIGNRSDYLSVIGGRALLQGNPTDIPEGIFIVVSSRIVTGIVELQDDWHIVDDFFLLSYGY